MVNVYVFNYGGSWREGGESWMALKCDWKLNDL